MPILSGMILQKIVILHIFSKSYLRIVFFRSYVYNVNKFIINNATTLY